MRERMRIGPVDDLAAFVDMARVAVESPKARDRLRAVAALREWLPLLERDAVEQAVAAGASWARIADALGVSRQSVHEKHAEVKKEPDETRRQRIVEDRAFDAWARAEVERAAEEHFARVRRRQAEA